MNTPNEGNVLGTILATLYRAPVCASLAYADLAGLASLAVRRDFAPGEWLFHEGTACHWLGVVEHGDVELMRGPLGCERRVTLIGPGGVLAGGLLLDDLPHATSARTPEGASVIQLLRSRVLMLRTEHPTLFYRLASNVALSISERLRAQAEALARGVKLAPWQTSPDRVGDGERSR